MFSLSILIDSNAKFILCDANTSLETKYFSTLASTYGAVNFFVIKLQLK